MNPWKVLPLAVVAVLTAAACGPVATQPPAEATAVATRVAGIQTTVETPDLAGIQTQTYIPTVETRDDPSLGTILVDYKGMTLYRFTNDQPNVSNCYDQCATNWPPLIVTDQPMAAAGIGGTFGTTTRTDGSTQATYNGMPLYYFVRDTQAGDTKGQGLNGVWFVVQPGM